MSAVGKDGFKEGRLIGAVTGKWKNMDRPRGIDEENPIFVSCKSKVSPLYKQKGRRGLDWQIVETFDTNKLAQTMTDHTLLPAHGNISVEIEVSI